MQVVFGLILLGVGVLAYQVITVRADLTAAKAALTRAHGQLAASDLDAARQSLGEAGGHTAPARSTTQGPLWRFGTTLPWVGDDLDAVAAVAEATDRVAGAAGPTLLDALTAADPATLAPHDGRIPVDKLAGLAAPLRQADAEASAARRRVGDLDTSDLVDAVREPVAQLREQLDDLAPLVHTAADVAAVAPDMLGAHGTRRYLLLIQNPAEARATGGIPGALALLTVTDGRIELTEQSSAAALGVFEAPVLSLGDAEAVHSPRLGQYLQDVTFTPDFPTSAALAAEMWRRHTISASLPDGQRVDGVLSVDPVALSYLMRGDPKAAVTVPRIGTLTAENMVSQLLAGVYAAVPDANAQDAVFAQVARSVFDAVTAGRWDTRAMGSGVRQAAAEGRLLAWSSHPDEQHVIEGTPVGGALTGQPSADREIGVFFNDGTGGKMSYYLRPAIRVGTSCAHPDEAAVAVTVRSDAPADAARRLGGFVTGGGRYGVPAGTTMTVVLVYAPAGAGIDKVSIDGVDVPFSAHTERGRAVAAVAVDNAPGTTRTVTAHLVGVTHPDTLRVRHTPLVADIPVTLDPAGC